MSKKAKSSVVTVRDPKSGKLVTVHGAGAFKGRELPLRAGIDLTKPIAEQVPDGKRR